MTNRTRDGLHAAAVAFAVFVVAYAFLFVVSSLLSNIQAAVGGL